MEQPRPSDDDSVLRWLTEGTASTTGHQFFRALVQGLCGALGTKGFTFFSFQLVCMLVQTWLIAANTQLA